MAFNFLVYQINYNVELNLQVLSLFRGWWPDRPAGGGRSYVKLLSHHTLYESKGRGPDPWYGMPLTRFQARKARPGYVIIAG